MQQFPKNLSNKGKEEKKKVNASIEYKKKNEFTTNDNLEEEFNNQKQIANEHLFLIMGQKMLELTHRSIIAMKVNQNTKMVCGSGVLLSKNIILTAAHNIYHKNFKDDLLVQACQVDIKRVQVYLGGIGQKTYEVEDWRILQQYKTCSKKNEVQFDYALIKLKEREGLPCYGQFLSVCLPCSCIQQNDPLIELNIYGYPNIYTNYNPLDKYGITVKLCQYGLTKKESIISVQQHLFRIKYVISTHPGQSGCPLVVDNKIIGVHKGGMQNQQCNFGRLITKDLISNIQKWCQQLKGDLFKVDQSRQCHHTNKNINKVNKLTSKVGQTIEGAERLQQLAKKYHKHDYAMALLFYQKSLEIKEKIKGKESVQAAGTVHQIGVMYYCQPNYTKALDYYTMALQIYEKAKGKGCLESATTLNNLGSAYKNQLKYAEAIECYKQSKSIYQNQNIKSSGYGSVLFNTGLLYYDKLEDYEEAAKLFQSAIKVYEQLNDKDMTRRSAIEVAKCMKKLNKKDELNKISAKYGLKAYQI